MDQNAKKIMEEIEDRSNISIDEIYNIAHAIQYDDLSDEKTIRYLVRRLSNLANRPISKDKENQIVRSIINNEIPSSMESLRRYFD
ncbi:stage VI sporulation protein F [Pseudogracilibacillus sp. SO30301A]|uniref:stage VI sporulation protein F n=1 Tax=Pseudogracilibacillus sp. SO30301A TaxID=3098291 RepID=UPI00300E0528